MPNRDNFDSLSSYNQEWNAYWTNPDNLDESQTAMGIQNEENLDNEAKRRKRELASGYYFDSAKAFCPSILDQSKYTASTTPVEKVSRKSSLPETTQSKPMRGTEEGTTDNVSMTDDQLAKEIAEDAKLSHDQISGQIEKLYASYEALHSQNNPANMEKLCDLALRMFALWQRMNSRHDQELSADHTSTLKAQVKKVQDTYNHIGAVILTVASSLITCLSGLGQAAGSGIQLAGVTRWPAAKVDKFIDIAKGAALVGQGVGAPSQLLENGNQSLRTLYNHYLEEKKRHRDNHTQNSQKATQSGDSHMYNLKEHNKQINQAKQAMMGVQSS